MLKKALYVYFSGYHPRNYKKLLNILGVWSFSYFILLPVLNDADTIFASAENTILYYFLILSLIFMFGGNVLVPLTLQKQMFLCPMEEGERQKYILALTIVKIAVPVVVTMVLFGIQFIFFQKNMILLSGILFAYFSLAVSITMSPGVERIKKENHASFWAKKGVAQTLCISNIFLALFHIFVGNMGVLEETEISLGLGIYMGISVVLQLIFVIWLLKRSIPVILENAVDYEAAFLINKDVKKQ